MRQTWRNILVLVAGFAVLHMVFKGWVFLVIAIAVLLLSAASPRIAVGIERGWLWLGGRLGAVNGAILLFLVHTFLLTPIALLSRISGNDALRLKRPVKSNWKQEQHTYGPDDLRNPW